MTMGLPFSSFISPRYLPGVRIEGVELAVGKIPDDQRTAECAKIRRRECDTPRGLEMVSLNQSLQQVPARVEDVHEAGAAIGFLVRLLVTLLRIRHVQLAAEVLDVEGGIAVRNVRIAE